MFFLLPSLLAGKSWGWGIPTQAKSLACSLQHVHIASFLKSGYSNDVISNRKVNKMRKILFFLFSCLLFSLVTFNAESSLARGSSSTTSSGTPPRSCTGNPPACDGTIGCDNGKWVCKTSRNCTGRPPCCPTSCSNGVCTQDCLGAVSCENGQWVCKSRQSGSSTTSSTSGIVGSCNGSKPSCCPSYCSPFGGCSRDCAGPTKCVNGKWDCVHQPPKGPISPR